MVRRKMYAMQRHERAWCVPRRVAVVRKDEKFKQHLRGGA